MCAQITPRVLKGFRDFLPEKMIPREAMLRAITAVFESYGFVPLATPVLEYSETLLGKYGDEGDQLLYRFRDNGDRDVSMRYDLTIPLARVVGQYPQLDKPFKRYQIAPVWRAEKPAKGRFREFMQCDVDIVGVEGLLADAECILVGCDVLDALNVGNYQIRVNNRKILDGMMERIGVDEVDKRTEILRTVDKLSKIGAEAMRQLLLEENKLSADQAETLFVCFGSQHASLAPIRRAVAGTAYGEQGVDELQELLELVAAVGRSDRVAVDLSIARGLDYYTGTIYETFLLDLESLGSVMSGGRYDNLMGLFSKNGTPAVGISLGIDRLFEGLLELGMIAERAAVTDVLVTLFDAGGAGTALAIARQLRSAGLNTEVSLMPTKLGKQFKYANKKAIPWVVVVGPEEAAAGQATLKNMASGEQLTVLQSEIAAQIGAHGKP